MICGRNEECSWLRPLFMPLYCVYLWEKGFNTMAEKEYKEIDITSLDSELAAAKAVEEGKKDKFIKIATIVAFCMTLFHIYTGFFGLFDFVTQRGIHLAFTATLILLTQPLYKHLDGRLCRRSAGICGAGVLPSGTGLHYAGAGPDLCGLCPGWSKPALGHCPPGLLPGADLLLPGHRPGRPVRHHHERVGHRHLYVRDVRRVPGDVWML